MERLGENRRIVREWAFRTWRVPEATYLGWLNLPTSAEHIERVAKVKLSAGAEFGEGTDVDTAAFTRLNFATSPGNLRRILARVGECLHLPASPDFVAT
jgi:cystathionine beta-lyase